MSDKGTIKDSHMLDYMEGMKVGELMIAKTKISGKLRKFVITRVKSNL